MNNRSELRQVLMMSLCEAGCVGIMLLVYFIIGKLSPGVLIGALAGWAVTSLNFLALTVSVTNASTSSKDEQSSARAVLAVRGSAVVRLLVMAVVLIVLLKFSICDPLATLLPLLFVRPSLMLLEFFGREGKKTDERS